MTMKTLWPAPLQPGDTIGVMAPSSYVERDDIEKSKALLEGKGYKVFIHPQTYEREHQSAGTILQKTLALQGLWQREDIKAIWTAGGGNRALHLVNAINFERMKKTPKILIGFSDVTALLNALYAQTGIVTFHGPVFKNLYRNDQLDDTLALLEGRRRILHLDGSEIVNNGIAEGPLVGGNLSLFQYLPQTLPGDFYKGAILFLEDCNEELSRVDRMLLHLKRLGVFDRIHGLILGEFSGMHETGRPFGYTLHDLVTEHLDGRDVPILVNAPFGHGPKLYTLPIGAECILNAGERILSLKTLG